MKRKNHVLIGLILALASGLLSPQAMAESQAACKIWLCLPAGFGVAECGDAKSEFKHRIKHGQPPLPPLNACSDDNTKDFSYTAERGYMKAAVTCSGTRTSYFTRCTPAPAQWTTDYSCIMRGSCRSKVKVQIYEKGKPFGNAFLY